MDQVQEFLRAPTDIIFETLTREQLREVANHFDFDKTLERSLKKTKLIELAVLSVNPPGEVIAPPAASSTPDISCNELRSDKSTLSFEQQLELLKLEVEKKRVDAVERIRECEVEQKRLEAVEREKNVKWSLNVYNRKRSR